MCLGLTRVPHRFEWTSTLYMFLLIEFRRLQQRQSFCVLEWLVTLSETYLKTILLLRETRKIDAWPDDDEPVLYRQFVGMPSALFEVLC